MTLSNIACDGEGSDAKTYSSNDTSVANVNVAGLLTVLGRGNTTLNASKAADAQFAAAIISYTLNSAPSQVAITAWIGSSDTDVNFPGTPDGPLDFPSCLSETDSAEIDILFIHSCGARHFSHSSHFSWKALP